MELKNIFVTDLAGNVIPSAIGRLYLAGTTTLAGGLQDKDGNAQGNPIQANSIGQLQFAAPDGRYDLYISSAIRNYTIRVEFFDTQNKTTQASLRTFGAVMDGTTNDYAALSACLAAGKIPVFDGASKILAPDAGSASTLLASLNKWQLMDKVSLVLPASNSISAVRVMDLNNPTLGNLSISGSFVDAGIVTSLASAGGTAKAWLFDIGVPSATGIAPGDYLMLKPSSTSSFALCDAFVTGCWKILSVTGNVLRISTANANPALPAAFVTGGNLTAQVVKTVVRFPRDSAGIRLNGAILGSMTNIVWAGQFNIVTETAADGFGDGLQVGGAADKYSTGLNESEQIHAGAIWCQRVAFNEFQGNGTQDLHGALYGSLMFACGNSWRGQQAAGSGEVLIKGCVSAGNGASGVQSEKVGGVDFADGWSIGNQQQGILAIGLSQVDALRAVCMYNQFSQVDARNGGNLILDTATISGTDAIFCNGGRVLLGDSAVVTGTVTVNETGTVIAKGATSVTGTISVETGSIYQLPDGTIYSAAPDLNRLAYNSNWQYRVSLSSIGDLNYQWAAAGSGTWTTSFTFKKDGDFYPNASTQNLGRAANQWNNFYGKNIVLQPAASVTPVNNGDVMLQLTSNTSLTFKVKGSDGVVRSASVTLA